MIFYPCPCVIFHMQTSLVLNNVMWTWYFLFSRSGSHQNVPCVWVWCHYFVYLALFQRVMVELFMNSTAWFKVLPLIRSLDVVRMETKGLCGTRDGHYRLMNEPV